MYRNVFRALRYKATEEEMLVAYGAVVVGYGR